MDHRHCNLLEVDALVFGFQLVRGVYIQHFSPDIFGEKVNCFLTDQITLSQSTGIETSRTFGAHCGITFTGVL